MADEQYSFVPPKAAQKMVKWVATLLAGAVLPGLVFAMTWVQNVATIGEVDKKIEEQFRLFDPGSFSLEKHDPRRVNPPPDGYAYAAAACRRDLEETRGRVLAQQQLLVELYRNFVRTRAADAEPNRSRRAHAAANAVKEFESFLRSGMQPDEAMRRALEVNPYTM